jgi:hypothetical protein
LYGFGGPGRGGRPESAKHPPEFNEKRNIMSGEIKTVLVWGSPCTGKTINRDAMMEFFACDAVLDDPSREVLGLIKGGRVLVLSPDRDLFLARFGEDPCAFDPDVAYPIAAVERLLGDRWIDPEPRKSDIDRFWELLDNYPRLCGFWDREARECDIGRICNAGYLTAGESLILKVLTAIFTRSGRAEFRVDFTDLAALDREARQPLLDWVADPCWP